MSDHNRQKQSPQKASKLRSSESRLKAVAPHQNLQNIIGNQATLRLMRQQASQNIPSIQRDMHDHGCSCPTCARIQRQRDEKQLQRALIQRDGDGTVTPSIPFSELMALWKGRESKEKTVTPIQGVHSTVSVPSDPATATEVRSKVSSASPGSGGAVDLLAARVQELRGLNLSSEVDSQADLIPILADDMERKDQAKPVEERQNLSKQEYLEAAKSQIEGNKTTALTTSDDRYTAIKGGESFDELHEFIHICSAPGGVSPLVDFQLQMNEGAINFFSELVAPAVGTKVVTRYTNETPLVTKMVALIGTEGIGKLFEATFKGDIDGFFLALGTAYVALGTNKPDGKAKSFSEKKWSNQEAANEFKSKTQAWNLTWLNQRL